jgi:hypothetical protein
LADVGEVASDLVAEARSELEHESAAPALTGRGKSDGR